MKKTALAPVVLLAIAASILMPGPVWAQKLAGRKPNIILIITDGSCPFSAQGKSAREDGPTPHDPR
jgi:hypothetical protein